MSARRQTVRTVSRSFVINDDDGNFHIFFIETYGSFENPTRPAFRAAAKRFVKSGQAVAEGYDISYKDGKWNFDVCIK